MRKFVGFAVAPLALVAAAASAGAATVRYPDGKVAALKSLEEVTGPATIMSESGKDTIEVRKGAVVRFLSSDTDAKGNKSESFFLKSGACDASLGFFTRLATPAFWAFPEKAGTRALFYAETFNTSTAYARSAKGSSILRLLVSPAAHGNLEVQLKESQGVTLQRKAEIDLRFTTDPHNEWRDGSVRVLYPLPSGLVIDLYVPKATAGFVQPKEGVAGKTDVKNQVTSWKSGKIKIVTAMGGKPTGEGDIGPGVMATIDNASGRIEIGFVKVEFATLKAALSLTSEFASLATSPITKP